MGALNVFTAAHYDIQARQLRDCLERHRVATKRRRTEIDDVFDATWELEQTGIEYLLADETTIDVIRCFLSEASEWDDYPHNSKKPGLFEYDPDGGDDHVRRLCRRVLKSRKGSGYAQRLVELCSAADLPDVVTGALEHISEDLPNELSNDGEDELNLI